MKGDVLDVIERAYDVDSPTARWLHDLAVATDAQLGAGKGLLAFEYTVGADHRVRVGACVGLGMADALAGSRLAMVEALPPEYVAKTFTRCECTTQTEVGRAEPEIAEYNRPIRDHFAAAFGVHDIVMVGGMDPHGNGIYLGAWMPRETTLRARTRSTWCRVAVHLVTALRLRKRLAKEARAPRALLEDASAILTPDGRVHEATGDANEEQAREALRSSARDLAHVRSSAGRRDPDKAVGGWAPLVDARWSLVDHFDADGKRFFVACRNDVTPPSISALSVRERQVLAFAALGHSNKLIAYELGIAASTVRVLLHRAAAKLGATSREELVAKFVDARTSDTRT